MEKLKLLMVTLLLGLSSTLLAQTKVSGVVADELGMPIPGANVVVKGTTNGTVTDFDGIFEIEASSGAILQFSYIGYSTKEVAYKGQSSLNVTLTEDTALLDEVVVIGYGSVKKSDLTGAVASLSAENLTEQKKTDIGQALQGRVAGVDVRTLNSKPGAPLNIQIRGNTVITANQGGERDGVSDDLSDDPDQPLYVVDGIFFDDINVLNPSDIQQMDILKDASATAIYGSRGANGVVIITTKNGIEGKTVFTYESSFGLRSATNIPDMLSGDEYVGFVDDVLRAREWLNTSRTVADYNNVTIDRSTEYFSSNGNQEVANVASGNYTDWMGLLRKTGVQTSHTVGMSGGANGLVYSGSLGYLHDEGVMGIEEFERYNISASLSKKVSDKLTVGIKTYLALSEREQGSRELFRSSLRLAPTVSAYDANGEPVLAPDAQDDRFLNPLYEADGAWRVNDRSLDVIANVFLNYKPKEWLNLKTQFSPNVSAKRFGEYRGLLTKSSRNDESRISSYYDSGLNTSYTWDNIADFNFDVAEGHNLKTTLITSIYYNNEEGSNIQVRNFDTDAYLFFNTQAGADTPNDYGTFYSKETLSSFAGRLNYSIKDKYLFTATGRYDGSSKLSEGNKWAFFPSAAFAWKASEEEFLQNTDWLNNLKLRVSYGESGNDKTVSPYSSLAFLSQTGYLFGDESNIGKVVSNLSNADLSWEISKEYNFGFELGVLNNRINLGFEYYNKKTEGSVLARQLSFITGFGDEENTPTAIGNFGSVRNSGIEVTLNTVNVRSDNFTWKTNINFSNNKNEILELYAGVDQIILGDSRLNGVLQVGAPIDAVFDYEVDGIWQIDEAAEADALGGIPGQYKFVDQLTVDTNGDGVPDERDGVINQDDKKVIGSQSPDWIAGMTNTFSYKNLELNVQVNTRQGVFGHSEFHQNFATFNGDKAVFNSLDQDYWTPNNPDGKYPSPEYGESNPWFYEDMSFVRIANIGMAYDFPDTLLDKFKMSSLRMTLNVQNPFTFTDFDGPDPETGLQNSYNMGYSVKTILFGLKLSY
ncbi:SusC/RagA family TonB-linked outer membrane protein [Cellulophaga baltica]|uniref:TonB-linked outer membrane protein, SusC/RagA family n=1 Tax=Cellulophaga baltica TaxID=76594 RepID=A0A1G7E3C8_9FLAO|nr:TonB-dependent receptor [Cellulophaga baltica]SDE58152.1 TonB-linked outer membrane protein, SusC/RagA family [Cellulophaga baltica]